MLLTYVTPVQWAEVTQCARVHVATRFMCALPELIDRTLCATGEAIEPVLRSIDVAIDLASEADLDALLSARTADGGLPDSLPKPEANGLHTPAQLAQAPAMSMNRCSLTNAPFLIMGMNQSWFV